jgi:hypothetical protein
MIPFDPGQILMRLCQIINYGLILNLPLIEGDGNGDGIPRSRLT